MGSTVEEAIKRLQSHKGVKGILILNADGQPIQSNLPVEDTGNYAALVSQLNLKASGVVRALDEADELQFLRVRSKKNDIMVASTKEFSLLVVAENGKLGKQPSTQLLAS
eukprot:210728_1